VASLVFPEPPGPIRGGEPMLGDELADRGDISVPADEAGQLGTHVGLPVLRPASQLAPQQRDVQCGQLR
jgi:hypothetical protein